MRGGLLRFARNDVGLLRFTRNDEGASLRSQ